MEETKVEETKTEETPVVAEPAKPEPVGIKNSLEVVKGLELLAEIAEGVFADGRLDGSDFLVVAAKLKELDIIVDAVQDADEIGKELKDLDEQELIQLGLAAYSLVKKVVAATKKNKEVK